MRHAFVRRTISAISAASLSVAVAAIAGLTPLLGCSPSDAKGFAGNPGSAFDGGASTGDSAAVGTFGNGSEEAGAISTCQKMDIVFVVDNSGSMAEEQKNLASNFPLFIDVLNTFKTEGGAALDYRVAVTTTGRDINYRVDFPPFPSIPASEQGDNGAFHQDCGMMRKWLERSDRDLAKTFQCVANVGTDGPGIEMPLQGAKLALLDRMKDGTNKGFLRDDALLALVILTDEDDCSREDDNFVLKPNETCDTTPNVKNVADYIRDFDQVKGARGRWASAVIAGPGPGSCKSSFGNADDATRLHKFVAQVGKNAVFSSICAGDLTKGLKDALSTFDAACRSFPAVR